MHRMGITALAPQPGTSKRARPTTPLVDWPRISICRIRRASCAWPGGWKPVSSASTGLVPFAPGGPTDFVARTIATPLSHVLRQPVVVDNKTGESGNIGAQVVGEGPADGYTLVHTTAEMQAVNPLTYPRFDFTKHVVPLGLFPDRCGARPKATERADSLTYATFANGTSPHVCGALLEKLGEFKALALP